MEPTPYSRGSSSRWAQEGIGHMGLTCDVLTILSIFSMVVGSSLWALDILKPHYLKDARRFLLDFSVNIKKTRIMPVDKRVTAHRKTMVQLLLMDKDERARTDFKSAYIDNLKQMNYEADLNTNLYYRTVVYIITAALLLVVFAYIGYKMGTKLMLSLSGLKLIGGYLFLLTGLLGCWFFDAVSEDIRKTSEGEVGMPPLYKMPSPGNMSRYLMLVFSGIHLFMNILAKVFAMLIRLSFKFEKYTIANQAPRVLGLLLVFMAAFLQLLAYVLSKTSS
jgi:hypothetical protein